MPKFRDWRLGAGWLRVDGLIPPAAVSTARAMIEEGSALNMSHACGVALSERPKLLARIEWLEGVVDHRELTERLS